MKKPNLDIELSNDKSTSLYVFGHEFELQKPTTKDEQNRILYSKHFHSNIAVVIEEIGYEITSEVEALNLSWDLFEKGLNNNLNFHLLAANDNNFEDIKHYKCFVWYNEILLSESYANTPHAAFEISSVNEMLEATEIIKNQLNEIRLGVKDQIILNKIKL